MNLIKTIYRHVKNTSIPLTEQTLQKLSKERMSSATFNLYND